MHAGQDVRVFYYRKMDLVNVWEEVCSAARFLTLDPFSETTISLERLP